MDSNAEMGSARDGDDGHEVSTRHALPTEDSPGFASPVTPSYQAGMAKWRAAAHILATGAIRAAQASKRGGS